MRRALAMVLGVFIVMSASRVFGQWYGFSPGCSYTKNESDFRNGELKTNCGNFTRTCAAGGGDRQSFHALCASMGKTCQKVCDWEGQTKGCDENPGDGSRVALCGGGSGVGERAR